MLLGTTRLRRRSAPRLAPGTQASVGGGAPPFSLTIVLTSLWKRSPAGSTFGAGRENVLSPGPGPLAPHSWLPRCYPQRRGFFLRGHAPNCGAQFRAHGAGEAAATDPWRIAGRFSLRLLGSINHNNLNQFSCCQCKRIGRMFGLKFPRRRRGGEVNPPCRSSYATT